MSYEVKRFLLLGTILIGRMYSTQSSTATFYPPIKSKFFMYSKEQKNPRRYSLIPQ